MFYVLSFSLFIDKTWKSLNGNYKIFQLNNSVVLFSDHSVLARTLLSLCLVLIGCT